ncbi:hypothetical protein [Bradyrhizobium sp.]|uniref:hypothetical protein n=1 Tax=Bradyrhizobium sp. TaxID=376 RepID=UPI001E10EC0B|nr:hypothetical protein [Bradyrhizobium sp.]MBI5323068.1 hypothetical protein [Bradyrhizobium sp.]
MNKLQPALALLDRFECGDFVQPIEEESSIVQPNSPGFAQRRDELGFRPSEVRSFPPQPPIPAFGQAPQETRAQPANPGFSRIQVCLWTLGSLDMRRKSPKVSGLVREYSRFAETIGGDRFDPDCRPSGGQVGLRENPLATRLLE